MVELTRLKIILGFDDDTEDALLTVLKENAQTHIKAYIQVAETSDFPVILDWVADEITVKRYNRLSAEGLVTEGIVGIVHTYETDYLSEYFEVLDNYLRHTLEPTSKRRLVML
jgi:hypothetical protein